MAENQKTILVVEDNQAVCQILKEKLGEENYQVEIALDGEEALAKLESRQPDLILLDIIMPKLDGAQVAKILQQKKETKDIPVIVITNVAAKEAAEKIGDVPVAEILVKANHSLSDIVAKVKEYLNTNG